MLKIKKWVGFALALTMLAAAPLPALAAAGGMFTTVTTGTGSGAAYQLETNFELSDEQKQALEKIYEIIPELRELTEISVSMDETADTWHVWLNDAKDADEAVPFAADANLSFDAGSGELLGFNLFYPAWASEEMPSQQLARQHADAFIRQLLGDQADQYQISGFGDSGFRASDGEGNEISWQTLSVSYCPLVNGLPFFGGVSRVDVNVAGRVTGYGRYDQYDRYDRSKRGLDLGLFPPVQEALSLTAAEQVMAEKTTMQLTYGHPYVKQGSPILAYVADSPGYINALTGEPVEMYATGQPQQEMVKLVGQGEEMTAYNRSEAEALTSQLLGVDLEEMYFNRSEDYNWFPHDVLSVSYDWHTCTEGEPPGGEILRSVNLRTLADSGEIVGFHLYDNSAQDKQYTLTQEAALSTAMRFMERVLPEGDTEMRLQIWPDISETAPDWLDQTLLDEGFKSQGFSFFFGRLHQGISVPYDGYSVEVSRATGEVTYYSRRDEVLPAVLLDGSLAVPAEQAKAEYLRNMPLQLVYIWPEWFGQRAPAPLLVYTTYMKTEWYFIDALTGEAVLF